MVFSWLRHLCLILELKNVVVTSALEVLGNSLCDSAGPPCGMALFDIGAFLCMPDLTKQFDIMVLFSTMDSFPCLQYQMVGVCHQNVTVAVAVAERVPHRRRTSEELVSVLAKLSYVGHLESSFAELVEL